MNRVYEQGGGVRLTIKVLPGASRDRVIGWLGDALKVAVAKPPQRGAANAAVVQLIASELSVPLNAVRIIRGQGSPRKEIHVAGITADRVLARFNSDQARR